MLSKSTNSSPNPPIPPVTLVLQEISITFHKWDTLIKPKSKSRRPHISPLTAREKSRFSKHDFFPEPSFQSFSAYLSATPPLPPRPPPRPRLRIRRAHRGEEAIRARDEEVPRLVGPDLAPSSAPASLALPNWRCATLPAPRSSPPTQSPASPLSSSSSARPNSPSRSPSVVDPPPSSASN